MNRFLLACAVLSLFPVCSRGATGENGPAVQDLLEYAGALPDSSASAEQARPMPDIEEFCRGKKLCFLDELVANAEEKEIPGFFPDKPFGSELSVTERAMVIETLNGIKATLVLDLNVTEREMVTKALSKLNETELGRVTCQGMTGKDCSLEALAANGIYIKTDDLEKETPAQISLLAGKVIIAINRKPKVYLGKKSIDWAVTLGHELSHAEDYKKLHKSLTSKYRANTELKAYLYELAIYNEMKLRHPSEIKDPIYDFLIQVWDWKENGGSYPQDFIVIKDDGTPETVKAKEFMRDRGLDTAKTGIFMMRAMVSNHWEKSDPTLSWTHAPGDNVAERLRFITFQRGSEYRKWRKDGPILKPLPPPVALPYGGGDPGSGGGGGGDGGGGNNYGGGGGNVPPPPFNPNPHFLPWQ